MSEIPLNPFEIEYYYYFIIYIAVALIIFIIKLFFQDFFKNRRQKTKRNEFVKFLRYNNSVNNYIKQYEKIFFFERKWAVIYSYIGMLGFLIPLLFLTIIYNFFNLEDGLTNILSLKIIYFSIAITLSLTFIFIVLFKKYINSIIDEDKLLEKYISIANKFTLIEFYVIFSYLPISFLLFITFFSFGNEKINFDLFFTLCLLIFDMILFLSIPLAVFYEKQYFKTNLKRFLNLKGSKLFPYLCVTTKENSQINGRIKDIFNDKLLFLEDKEVKKVTSWDSICTLEIIEVEIQDLKSQKKLRDFI